MCKHRILDRVRKELQVPDWRLWKWKSLSPQCIQYYYHNGSKECMCHLQNIAMCDYQTDAGQSDPYAMQVTRKWSELCLKIGLLLKITPTTEFLTMQYDVHGLLNLRCRRIQVTLAEKRLHLHHLKLVTKRLLIKYALVSCQYQTKSCSA